MILNSYNYIYQFIYKIHFNKNSYNNSECWLGKGERRYDISSKT